jgi:hypothetical protein
MPFINEAILALEAGVGRTPSSTAGRYLQSPVSRWSTSMMLKHVSSPIKSNRLLMPFINEAILALEAGVGSKEDIDTTLKLGMNHPMGPLTGMPSRDSRFRPSEGSKGTTYSEQHGRPVFAVSRLALEHLHDWSG